LQSFEWAGIGFKYESDGPGMINADITSFFFPELPTDRFAESNRVPKLDTSLGGTSDILSPSFDPILMQYTWSRPLNSFDAYDQIYSKDAKMEFLWACGKMAGSTQLKHFKNNREKFPIILSEDFTAGCFPNFLPLN
jgi:hypothetical protein